MAPPAEAFPDSDEPAEPGIPGQLGKLPPVKPATLAEERDRVVVRGGGMEVAVYKAPFGLVVTRLSDGKSLLRSASVPGSKVGFVPASFGHNKGEWSRMLAWWQYRGKDGAWSASTNLVQYQQKGDRVRFLVGQDGGAGQGRIYLVVGPFYDGAVRVAAAAPAATNTNRLALTFHAPGGERYVGFGERFNRVDQRGRIVWSWAEEGGINPGSMKSALAPAGSDAFAWPGGETTSYAPMPFYISNRGYGLLADVPEPTHFDLGATHPALLRITAEARRLALVIFDGPTPAGVLKRYTDRTGRSQVPRPWALAPWNMFVGYKQGGLSTVARLFRDKDIPSSVTHEWTAILPNGSHRKSTKALKDRNAALHALGYKSLCYLQARVDKDRYPTLWNEGDKKGYFIKDKAGKSYLMNLVLNAMNATVFNVSLIDFTHAGVDAWWAGILKSALDLGYDGFMYDFGEYVPPDSVLSDGQSGHRWHNAYPLIYQRSGHRFFASLDDDPKDEMAPDYLYFVRSAYAGSQAWTYAMWGGDPEADWSQADGLPASVVGGVNAGLSGMPFWGSDTGGFHAVFVPPPTSELHKRWVQFSAFSGLMRDMTAEEINKGKRIHVLDEPELTMIVRKYQKLRTQLSPYIMAAARQAHRTGLPLMRAPLLHDPDDGAAWAVTHAFHFGPDLYVAPVIKKGDRTRTLYLPRGEWVQLWPRTEYDGTLDGKGIGGFRLGGDLVKGGRTITVQAPVSQIPIFARLSAVIPLLDPRVDTLSPTQAPAGVEVTTVKERASLLHAWIFPGPKGSAYLSDGGLLTAERLSDGTVSLKITGGAARGELWAQVFWPPGHKAPAQISGLTRKDGADPLTLSPGTWTYSTARRSLCLRGKAGVRDFLLKPGP